MNKSLLALTLLSLSACGTLPNPDNELVGGTFYLDDDIRMETLYRFTEVAHEIDTLVLTSGGGAIGPAMAIGLLVDEYNITTYVPDGKLCASACGFIFMAGERKVLHGLLGLHEFSTYGIPYRNLSAEQKVLHNDVVISLNNYLGFIGTSFTYYTDMMKVHNNGLRVIGADEANEYLLVGKIEGKGNDVSSE